MKIKAPHDSELKDVLIGICSFLFLLVIVSGGLFRVLAAAVPM